jgi:metal-sulfur cluster biosynthetic enzyme
MSEPEIDEKAAATEMPPGSSGRPGDVPVADPGEAKGTPSGPDGGPGAGPESANGGGGGADREEILNALRNVFDPELGINIVDLGLVYDVVIDAEGGVDITYSLTTMGCPIGPMIEDQMRQFLTGVAGVGEVRPEMVLRPPWSPEMMSDEAKASLGIF